MCAGYFEAESTISTKVLRQELGEDETMKLRFAGESQGMTEHLRLQMPVTLADRLHPEHLGT